MSINHFGGDIIPQFFDRLGKPILFGRVDFFENKTTNPKNVFTDSTLSISAGSSIPTDAAGRVDVWLDGPYRVRVFDKNNTQQWEHDDVNLDVAEVATQASLVPNGSMEFDGNLDGIPDGWVALVHPGGAITHDNAQQTHGTFSVKFTGNGGGGGVLTSEDFILVNPTRRVYFSLSRISNIATVRNIARVLWFKADKTPSVTPNSTLFDQASGNPTTWFTDVLYVFVPSDAKFAKLELTGVADTGGTLTGTTNYDDVQFASEIKLIAPQIGGVLDLTDGGIKFPAVQIPSADPNTLDDYEEGTWTPGIGGTATYNEQTGKYSKLGRVYEIEFVLRILVRGTGSAVTIQGLPALVATEGPCPVNVFSAATAVVSCMGRFSKNNTTLSVFSRTVASTTETNSTSIFADGAVVDGKGFFTV